MMIDRWDVESANARLHRVTYGNHSTDNESDWVKGSPFPVFLPNRIGFKQIECQLILRETKEEAMSDVSTILSHLLNPVELTLDNREHKFYGIMTKNSVKETVQERWYDLMITFDCIEYSRATTRTIEDQREFTINNPGNILTPVKVELMPVSDQTTLTITGLSRNAKGTALPITVRNLTTGKKIIIDGETGLITQENISKAGDVDLWSTPTLLPKKNLIKLSVDCTITLTYKPRFM